MNYSTSDTIVNALSFDIEDWFHMVEIEAVSDTEKWSSYPTLVERYTDWILEQLDNTGVNATFFMLGWIADKYPELVKRIASGGHELASHSYWHRRVDILNRKEFYLDTKQSIDAIEQRSGQKVLGFRAPSFSITPGAEWAFDVMHDLDLMYDASLFPVSRGHGGYPCPHKPHEFVGAPSGKPMMELPMSTMKIGPKRLAFSGGGYMRLLPSWVIKRGFAQMHRQGLPTVVYLHPRDFATDAPRVTMPLHRKFKSYVGLKGTKKKLNMLLTNYRFDTCAKLLNLSSDLTTCSPKNELT
ncbi:polysaccharide deacetylase family protein [Planctomycetota bacterium]|nr:polysaccharide deacetylase family protein [Planctomycetota bacterium]